MLRPDNRSLSDLSPTLSIPIQRLRGAGLTVKGMVETENTASYGIMEVYPDKLFLKGYGDQEDLILEL